MFLGEHSAAYPDRYPTVKEFFSRFRDSERFSLAYKLELADKLELKDPLAPSPPQDPPSYDFEF